MEVLSRYAPLIDDFDAFIAACRDPLPFTVRIQTSRVNPERVHAALDAVDIDWTPVPWESSILRIEHDAPGRTLPAYLGWIHSQEVASCLPVPLLDVEPGDRVWDTCAAPGSKTGHLVDVLEDEGLVMATDDNLGRLSALRFNTERLGATCVAVDHADASRFDPSIVGVESFDATLVDAPCSCEGTVRKNPAALQDWDRQHIDSLASVQRRILSRAIECTTEGGRVVYATCTFAPEENEAVVDEVVSSRDCHLEQIELPIEAKPGVTEWDGETFDSTLTRTRRVYPHLSDTGGFYLAAIRVGA